LELEADSFDVFTGSPEGEEGVMGNRKLKEFSHQFLS
jgi:hypothetical protein